MFIFSINSYHLESAEQIDFCVTLKSILCNFFELWLSLWTSAVLLSATLLHLTGSWSIESQMHKIIQINIQMYKYRQIIVNNTNTMLNPSTCLRDMWMSQEMMLRALGIDVYWSYKRFSPRTNQQLSNQLAHLLFIVFRSRTPARSDGFYKAGSF